MNPVLKLSVPRKALYVGSYAYVGVRIEPPGAIATEDLEFAVPAGPAIGATWGVGGKDRHFVIVLCAGARRGGARSHAPNE